jgi:hypothetical protein
MLIDNITGSNYTYEMYLCKPYDSMVGCTPNHEILGCLTECSEISSVKEELRNVSELNFSINKYWNDIDRDWGSYNAKTNENFDLVVDGLYVLLQKYIDDTLQKEEYFYICNTKFIGDQRLVKEVSCYSKEYLWNKIKIRNFTDSDTFSTTRKIYTGDTFDAATPSLGGIMDYVIQEKLQDTWFVTYVSPEIENVYRTFDFNESSIPEVIRRIEDMFNCICFKDTAYHQLRFIHYDELSLNSNVVISDRNFLNNITKEIKTDEIVTRLYVSGKDDTVINGVNVTGKPYIDNFDYFHNSTYMSDSLYNALNDYNDLKEYYESNSTPTFSELLSTLTTKQTELTTLQTELFNLQTELYQLEDNEDLLLKILRYINPGEYNDAHELTLAKETEITIKETEIANKEAEIITIQENITAITLALEYSERFTTSELIELQQFINEDTVNCDTDDDDELYAYGVEVMGIRSTPPIDFTLSLVDLYNTIDGRYEWDKIELGNVINLEFEDFSISTQPRITAITHSSDNDDLSLTVSNKPFFNSELDYLSSMMAITQQNSTLLNNERETYLEYSNNEENLIQSGDEIDTENNTISMGDGTTLTRRGQFLRDVLEATGQMRILGDRILFTRNNWEDEDGISVAITSEGIFCEKFFAITNGDGSVEINENSIVITDMDLTMTTARDNTIYLNPDIGFKILQGSTPTFYAETDGSLYLKNVYIQNEDGSISISPQLIDILNGKIRVRHEGGVETILDAYGIEPKFLDYHKNYVWNSSFEIFDPDTLIPQNWSDGIASSTASFQGTYSCKIEDGVTIIQSDDAAINPDWTNYANVRVAFQCRCATGGGGEIICSVYDKTNDNYFTIWDNNGNESTTLTFETPETWLDSRFTFAFDPAEIGHPSCTEYKLKFSNNSGIHVYLDCVQASVDFSGKWAQLYKIGPYSLSATEMPDFEYWVNYYEQYIYVQPDEPATPRDDDCWIDTDAYNRYEALNANEDKTVLMLDEEVITCTIAGITVTLQTPTQDGCIKYIKNISSGSITISGDLENGSTMKLFPLESIILTSYNSTWYIS